MLRYGEKDTSLSESPMKIKSWLIVSYILVMLLPLLAGWGLYILVIHYHEQQEMDDYFDKFQQLGKIRQVLEQPELYQVKVDRSAIEELKNPQTEIKLYLKEGYLIYTTNPFENTLRDKVDFSQLYANLYQFDYSYSAYSYKAPVFVENVVVGLYEVKLARDKWIQGVSDISKLVIGLFVLLLFFILFIVMRKVHKKITQPIDQLIENFNAFPTTKEVIPSYGHNDEMGALYDNFRSMQLELLAAEELTRQQQLEKEMMIASISHDLKTPLTSIRAFAEAIVQKPQKGSEHAPVIIGKADYMQKMLTDLMFYSVLQSPKYELQVKKVDAEEFFEMLLQDYDSLMEEKNLNLKTSCHVTGELLIDVSQWMRIVDNLVANAVKFTPPTGKIQLVATQEPHKENLYPFTIRNCSKPGTYFIVENSGDGISKEELELVLQPLYQVDEARTKAGSGIGLGLTIAKQILEKHGGSLQIVSEIGIGTGVICYLPQGGDIYEMDKNIKIRSGD